MKLTKHLRQEFEPRGTLENFMVDRIALGLIHIERASKFESQHIQSSLHPPRFSKSKLDEALFSLTLDSHRDLLDPGIPPELPVEAIAALCDTFSRY
jgi:hypothetical protein